MAHEGHEYKVVGTVSVIHEDHLEVRATKDDKISTLKLTEKTKSRFVSREGVVDIWIYPGVRLHQDQVRATAHSTFRILFVDGRVRVIEAL